MQVVVAPPVGVDDVVTEAAAPRLAGVDVRRDRGMARLRDHQRVVAAEGRVEEVAVVVDVVVAGEKDRVHFHVGHKRAQLTHATLELLSREGRLRLRAVLDALQTLEIHDCSLYSALSLVIGWPLRRTVT